MTDMMDCDETSSLEFAKCLRLIVMGSPNEIEIGWKYLLEKYNNEEINNDNLTDVRDIIGLIVGRSIININQVPKLMAYFSTKLKDNPFEVNTNKNTYTLFLKNTGYNDIKLLADIIQALLEHKNIYLSTKTSKLKFCEATVRCLSDFSMPVTGQLVTLHKKSSERIHIMLKNLCEDSNIIENENLIFKCLETLYEIISDTEINYMPGAALVGILQLVKQSAIEQSVRWIINMSKNDNNLEQALRTLCTWLTQCLHDSSLSLWITSFINGLEEVKKYSVLQKISDQFLSLIIKLLKIPIGRPHRIAVIYIILRSQHTPSLFHRVIKDIELIFSCIGNDKDELSKKAIQSLVDCTKALIIRFPGYKIYENLEKSFPVKPRIEIVTKILKGQQWIDNSDIDLPNTFYFNFGKVGLTNLGNTCYMNSVLQALVMTKQFCQEVLSYKQQADNNSNIILCKLQKLFALLLYSKRISLSPTEVLQASRPAYFTPGQQQDSSEFLWLVFFFLFNRILLIESN